VIENAALKLWLCDRRGAEERVRPLLERLGLGGRLRYRSEQLSIGERQRLMIALALSMQPRLVLADEPTGSLDTQRGNEVLALLREVCEEQQVAMLLVTHDPQAAAFADRVLELRDGRLGPYQSVASTLGAGAS
jgi:putative ABC transport system ATP-binding protein